jgi:hypothetical protein
MTSRVREISPWGGLARATEPNMAGRLADARADIVDYIECCHNLR